MLAQLADGATLVLQALHRTWPPLIRFGSTLAAELGHPAQINAYITPPQNQGFAAHYDNHDVFVLQVSGRKRWRIHEPVLVDPLPEQNWEQFRAEVAARAAEEPLIDTVLEPGDALYLPRGYLHSAVALGDLTIHLTVGVHPVTRNTVLRNLLQIAADDPQLRASLPMGVDLADPAVLAAQVSATARALATFAERLTPAQADAVAGRVGAALAENTRPEPIGPLAQGAAAAALTSATPPAGPRRPALPAHRRRREGHPARGRQDRDHAGQRRHRPEARAQRHLVHPRRPARTLGRRTALWPGTCCARRSSFR